jgi:uncharacterized protein (TIGR00369 family)
VIRQAGEESQAPSAWDPSEFQRRCQGRLPGLLGFCLETIAADGVTASLVVRPELLAPNGYLHAATVVGLADTACGFGTLANLPLGASGFTTIELKSNFTATARGGTLTCRARCVHRGRLTQVWDAEVRSREQERVIAHFRCTQMILFPRGTSAAAGAP